MKTRIAIAEQAWDAAADHLHEALSIVESFAVPVAAWQVHATAWDFYRHTKNDVAAESNRAFAESHILSIANSFISDDPLRRSFLSAPPCGGFSTKHQSQRSPNYRESFRDMRDFERTMFKLDQVNTLGRLFEEYRIIFALNDTDIQQTLWNRVFGLKE